MFDVKSISGIGEFVREEKILGEEQVEIYRTSEAEKAFLIVRKNTIEVRTDRKLSRLLRERYESVMESRYFGRGGIEVVMSGQLSADELCDLVRLSYNLTVQP